MSWKALAAGSLLAVQVTTGISASMAADMPRGMPEPLPPPRVRPIDISSGWYVRGDIGYAWGRVGSAESTPPFTGPSSSSVGNGVTGDVGVGYKSGMLRTDVTLDYLAPLKYQGTVAAPGDVSAKMSAWSALFNGYLDLGTWYRATPYIGGGVGAARVTVSDYASTAAPPFAAGLSNAQWNFAWAGMAGIGYAVSPNVIADLGYRYINYGNAKSAADAFGSTTLKNVAAHEVRVGIRWSFDDLPLPR